MYTYKKILIPVFLLIISFAGYGCNKNIKNSSSPDKLHTMLSTLKNYEADVTITFLKDKEAHILKMKQQAETAGKYRLITESPDYLKGYTINCDGKNVTEYHPATQVTLSSQVSEARNQTLFTSFLYNYLNADEIKRENETWEDKETVSLEVIIPGNYRYLARQKVWFDANKLKPLKMEIYDTENNKTLEVEFQSFKHNTQIDFNT